MYRGRGGGGLRRRLIIASNVCLVCVNRSNQNLCVPYAPPTAAASQSLTVPLPFFCHARVGGEERECVCV